MRKHEKDLRKLDKNSREYWEEVLRRKGLTMDAGRNWRKLFYVGNSFKLDQLQEVLEKGEWKEYERYVKRPKLD